MFAGSTALRRTAALLCLFAAFLLASCSRQPRYAAPPLEGTDIVIDVRDLAADAPRFYTYRYQDRNISFFVLKLATGVTSYLDACITCYPKHLGYEQKDGYVHCRACDMNYSVYKLEKGMGGCYPIRLEGRMENGSYRIAVAELQKHAGKF